MHAKTAAMSGTGQTPRQYRGLNAYKRNVIGYILQ